MIIPASEISDLSKRKSVQNAISDLRRLGNWLHIYEDLEGFIWKAEDDDPDQFKRACIHIQTVRNAVVGLLWKHEVFVSLDTVAQMVFGSLLSHRPDPVSFLFKGLQAQGLELPSFVLYPLLSFRFVDPIVFPLPGQPRKALDKLISPNREFVISAPVRDVEGLLTLIKIIRQTFGIRQRVERSLVEHYLRSRPTEWLLNNHLVAVRLRSFTNEFFDNQQIYVQRLKTVTATIMAFASELSEAEQEKRRRSLFTSSQWADEVYSFKHYVSVQPGLLLGSTPKKLDLRCIPVNLQRIELAEIADVPVRLNPSDWMASEGATRVKEIWAIMHMVEQRFIQLVLLGKVGDKRAKVARKLARSLDYFMRSHRSSRHPAEAVVALAIAFELLLTDNFDRGYTSGRLIPRVRALLPDGSEEMFDAVRALFQQRGDVVHNGGYGRDVNLNLCRQVYLRCLELIVPRIWNIKGDQPITKLIPLSKGTRRPSRNGRLPQWVWPVYRRSRSS